jgi:hypothetical protein
VEGVADHEAEDGGEEELLIAGGEPGREDDLAPGCEGEGEEQEERDGQVEEAAHGADDGAVGDAAAVAADFGVGEAPEGGAVVYVPVGVDEDANVAAEARREGEADILAEQASARDNDRGGDQGYISVDFAACHGCSFQQSGAVRAWLFVGWPGSGLGAPPCNAFGDDFTSILDTIFGLQFFWPSADVYPAAQFVCPGAYLGEDAGLAAQAGWEAAVAELGDALGARDFDGALRGVMAEGGFRGPVGSFMFMNMRLLNDQTWENVTGVGSPPWRWPLDEQVLDLFHKGVYAFVTGWMADRLVAGPLWLPVPRKGWTTGRVP